MGVPCHAQADCQGIIQCPFFHLFVSNLFLSIADKIRNSIARMQFATYRFPCGPTEKPAFPKKG
jgi:hypothetical protein